MTSYMTGSNLSRRSALRLVAISASGALLAACGVAPQVSAPTAPPVPAAAQCQRRRLAAPTVRRGSPAAPTTASAREQPPPPSRRRTVAVGRHAAPQHKTGGTLRFASTADVPNLDGHQRSAPSTDTVWTAYDRLTQYDANGKVQPMLAESWDVTPDYTQVKFNLRNGVQFHTGRELTSDDVKWNILRARDPKVASGSYVTWSNWFTAIDTPDKNTLVLTTDAPRPSMFDFFEWLNILDPVTMQGPDAQTKSIGTGPFVFNEWKQGESMTFSKNPNYWDTGQTLHRWLHREHSRGPGRPRPTRGGCHRHGQDRSGRRHRPLEARSKLPGHSAPVCWFVLRVRHQRHRSPVRRQAGAAGVQLCDRPPALRDEPHAGPGQTPGAVLELYQSGVSTPPKTPR